MGLISAAVGALRRRWNPVPLRGEPCGTAVPALELVGFRFPATDTDGNVIWPSDPDEVPAWRLERETWAELRGIDLPPYRTRREMERFLEHASAGVPLPVDVPLQILGAEEAAQRFLGWLRDETYADAREHTAQEMSELYARFCDERRILPAPVDTVKAHLALLPGVYRKEVNLKIDGRRSRQMRWIIECLDACEVPFDADAEPIRLAA